jgi:hypothetical protein
MKFFYYIFISIICISTIHAQPINQITISPLNPTVNDTITIISDFSYNGSCSHGLIYVFDYLIDSTIYINPIYCGFGLTTPCNAIDTFKAGPFPEGQFQLVILYNQYSVCPISSFETTLARLDTSILISKPLGINEYSPTNLSVNVYPNPARELLFVDFLNELMISDFIIELRDTAGKTVLRKIVNKNQFVMDVSTLAREIYFLNVIDNDKIIISTKVVLD